MLEGDLILILFASNTYPLGVKDIKPSRNKQTDAGKSVESRFG